MKFKRWEIALFAALFITVLCGFCLNGEQNNMADKMIRLHVVANSDSNEDQALKLKVRDGVLSQLEVTLAGAENKKQAEQILRDNLGVIEAKAEKTVQNEGYFYNVRVSLDKEAFPTRDYDTFSLPAGYYTSLRIVIGSGIGHNWWCVVFPPMCASAAIASDAETMSLTDEEASLITKDGEGYVIKFKAMEIVGKIITALGG